MFNLSIFFIERGDKTVLRDHTLQLMSTAHWAPAEWIDFELSRVTASNSFDFDNLSAEFMAWRGIWLAFLMRRAVMPGALVVAFDSKLKIANSAESSHQRSCRDREKGKREVKAINRARESMSWATQSDKVHDSAVAGALSIGVLLIYCKLIN